MKARDHMRHRAPRRRAPRLGWTVGCSGLALAASLSSRPALAAWSAGASLGWRTESRVLEPSLPPSLGASAFLVPRLGFETEDEAGRVRLLADQEALMPQGPARPPGSVTPRRGAGSTELLATRSGEWGGLRIDGRLARSASALDLGRPVSATLGGSSAWKGAGRAGLLHTEGGVDLAGWSFDDPRLADGDEVAWDAALVPVRSERDAWLVGWRQDRVEIAGVRALSTDLALAGYRRALAPGLAGQVEVGVGRTRRAAEAPGRGPAARVALLGPVTGGGPLEASLVVAPGLPTAVAVSARRVVGGARVGLSWESRLDAEGGAEGSLAHARRLAVSVEDTLFRANVLGVEASAARLWPVSRPWRHDDSARLACWVERRARPWLSARAQFAEWFGTGEASLGGGARRWSRASLALVMVR